MSSPNKPPAPPRQDDGIALISVMWLLLLLALIVASILATARTYYTTADTRIQSAKLKYAAEGAIQRAIYELVRTRSRGRGIPEDEANKEFLIGDIMVSVKIESEAGRVNINRADPDLLRFLMIEAGETEEDARAIAEAIIDWRDEDSVKSPRGAEALDYRAAGYAYEPRNGPFRALGELLQVKGMKPDLFACLRDDLTFYTAGGGLDEELASVRVKGALRMLREDRSDESGAGGRSLMNPSRSMSGNVLRIEVEARRPDNRHYNVIAILRPSEHRTAPAWIHGWLTSYVGLESVCGQN